eukprot:13298466-Ditylum_brightwellii.AAC.1
MVSSEVGASSAVLDQATKKVKCKVLALQKDDDNDDDDNLDENNNTNADKDDDEEDGNKMEGAESSVAAFICAMGAAAEGDKETAAMGHNGSVCCNRRLPPTH